MKKLKLNKNTFDSWVKRGRLDEAIIHRRGENNNRSHILDYDKAYAIIQGSTAIGNTLPEPKGAAAKAASEALESTDAITKRTSSNAAKAMKDAYQAQTAKLDYEERIGKLVDAKKVKRVYYNASRTVKNNLLAIPGRIAAEITGIKDDKEVENLITTEILIALEGLQNVTLADS